MLKNKFNNVGIIIQARVGSSRLPGKVLMPFKKTNLLGWIIRRVSSQNLPIIVATTQKKQDDEIAKFCSKININCFRGNESDLVDRYYNCAIKYNLKTIVRLTADNPFPDLEKFKDAIFYHLNNRKDYSNNLGIFPKGSGIEIYSIEALKKLNNLNLTFFQREHVNEYIFAHKEQFNINIAEVTDLNNLINFSIDTKDDYLKISSLAENLDNFVSIKDLIRLCS